MKSVRLLLEIEGALWQFSLGLSVLYVLHTACPQFCDHYSLQLYRFLILQVQLRVIVAAWDRADSSVLFDHVIQGTFLEAVLLKAYSAPDGVTQVLDGALSLDPLRVGGFFEPLQFCFHYLDLFLKFPFMLNHGAVQLASLSMQGFCNLKEILFPHL